MDKAVFPINTHSDITKAISFMHSNYTKAIESGKPLRVVIDQKQDDRSSAQNRLYWMWLGQIERKTGQHKDSLHFEFKKKYLIFIYKRDDQEFAEMCDSIARVKQMTEYLNYVHDFVATQLGVHLTIPEDLRWCWEY